MLIYNKKFYLNRYTKLKFWSFIGCLVLIIIIMLSILIYIVGVSMFNPFESLAMSAAKHSSNDVTGDLGGVSVSIPRHFANFVEYDDINLSEKRKDIIPKRIHGYKLNSFGYYTRFPDMAGQSSQKLIKDRESYSSGKTPWISVGINTGSIYPGDGFLDRATAQIGKSGDILKYEKYEQLPNQLYGLTLYVATGIDPKTNRPYREDTDAHDIFVHRDKKTNRVDAYIDCSNRNVIAPPCTHDLSLEPYMHAQVYVSYRRNLLPQWQEIQQSVTQQILGFKVTQAEVISIKH